MTNLFLNDSKYIAMSNRVQIIPDLAKTNKSEILGKLRSVFFHHFELVVDDFCMRIDLEFGLQLGKTREKTNKDQYVKLLEYLRSVREEIKQNYLIKINEVFDGSYQKTANNLRGQFDFSKIALISDDVVKENHAITQIIDQCEHLFYEELTSLNHKQFANLRGEQTIANSQNPIFPEKLVRALVDVVNQLKLNTDGRIALYKAFEANVFSQLGFIYGELIKRCEASNSPQLYVVSEIKEEAEPAFANVEQVSTEFSRLQKKLEQWRLAQFPSAYDSLPVAGNEFYDHFEVKNALQILQQFNDDSESGEKQQLLKWRVINKLKELGFSDKVKNMARHDEDVLDLAALIFSQIEQDEFINDAVKTVLLQLEIPLAAAALGRYSIFTGQDNPVRQLLDDLFAAGRFLNADNCDAQLIQRRISDAVKKLTEDSSFKFSVWTAEAGNFSDYLSKQNQLDRNNEENTRQIIIKQQTLASSRKIVLTAVESSMKGKALPTAIVDFLRDVWSEVLLDAMDKEGQWEKSVQAMDELIVSVIPPTDDQQRKRVLKALPGLIAELRNGLKRISYDKAAQSRFFKDLAVWHIILMDNKGKARNDSGVPVQGGEKKAAAIEDDSSEQAGKLAEQSWVAFNLESGRQWGKLLWKDAEHMLFVGRNGVKLFEMQVDELAEKLRLGQAALAELNDKSITDRVLTELINL